MEFKKKRFRQESQRGCLDWTPSPRNGILKKTLQARISKGVFGLGIGSL